MSVLDMHCAWFSPLRVIHELCLIDSLSFKSCILLLSEWYLIFMFYSMVYQAKVLEPLGAVTTGSQFLEPDGNI